MYLFTAVFSKCNMDKNRRLLVSLKVDMSETLNEKTTSNN